MSTNRLSFFRAALPGPGLTGLLEIAIALAAGAILAIQLHAPLSRPLSAWFGAAMASKISLALLALIALPLATIVVNRLLKLAARRIPAAGRAMVEVVVLGFLIAALAIPVLHPTLGARTVDPVEPRAPAPDAIADSGPLDRAPHPLKVERIALGAEISNGGTRPLDVGVMFVRPNERGRIYCAGKPLYGKSDRVRLGAGESAIFRSGNCQDGHVALTVWDASGSRIYQTSIHASGN